MPKNRARAYVPLAQQICHTIIPAIYQTLFPRARRYFKIISIGRNAAPQDAIERLENYFQHYLDRMQFTEKVKRALVPFVVYGNVAASIGWETHYKKFPVKDRRGNIVRVPMPIYDGPTFEVINPMDIVFDSNLEAVKPDSLYIRKSIKTYTELKSNPLIDQDALDKLYRDMQKKRKTASSDEGEVVNLGESETDNIAIFIARGDLNIDGELYENHIAIIGVDNPEADSPSGGTLLEFHYDDNDIRVYWASYSNGLFTYIGEGAVKPILGLQALTNTFSNQKADLLAVILAGAWKVVPDPDFDVAQLSPLYPGQVVEVSDINNLQSLAPSTDITPAFSELAYLRTEAQLSSGTNEFMFGSTTRVQGRRTASEAAFIERGSAGRLEGPISNLVSNILTPVLHDMFYVLVVTKLNSGEIEEVSDVLDYQYKVEFTGALTSALKREELENLMAYTQLIAKLGAQVDEETLDRIRYLLNIPSSKEVKLATQPTIGGGTSVNSPQQAGTASPTVTTAPQGQPSGELIQGT